MIKQVLFKTKGMQQDLSESSFNPEFAFENKNIRLLSTNNNTTLSSQNEKGNKLINISGLEAGIKGLPIGQATLEDDLILFTAGNADLREVSPIVEMFEPDLDITSIDETINITTDLDDRIYKITKSSDSFDGELLYEGDLNFNQTKPIEAISLYENSNSRKIYWTDNFNGPRFINLSSVEKNKLKWTNDSFDFTRKLKLNEKLSIQKNEASNGSFKPGIIQYAFTYFSKFGQESNIIETSPLNYIANSDRGGSPDEIINNSFNITISNLDKSFDYVRIYSIHRTSIDSTPEVKRLFDVVIPTEASNTSYTIYEKQDANQFNIEVFDILADEYVKLDTITESSSGIWTIDGSSYSKIRFIDFSYINLEISDSFILALEDVHRSVIVTKSDDNEFTIFNAISKEISVYDNGLSGNIEDSTKLLFIGGEDLLFKTMTHKDNTLFFGNITLNRKIIPTELKDEFKAINITIGTADKTYPQGYDIGDYPYKISLDKDSRTIKTFKYLEWYRLGIQFQHYTGKYSEPIWIKDIKNTKHVTSGFDHSTNITMPYFQSYINNPILMKKMLALGYIKVRPVIVYPTMADREVLCQGVLCPTVFNLGDRMSNSPSSQASWFHRPNAAFDIAQSFIDIDLADRDIAGRLSTNSKLGLTVNETLSGTRYNDIEYESVNKGAFAEFRHLKPIPGNDKKNAEIQCITNPLSIPTHTISATADDFDEVATKYNSNFFIDQSVLTLHSPDIEFNEDLWDLDTSKLKMRIVGIVPITSNSTDLDIQTSTPVSNPLKVGFFKERIGSENVSRFGWKGLITGAFWLDSVTNSNGDLVDKTTGFAVYPWHRNGSMSTGDNSKDDTPSALLSHKKMSNFRYALSTVYLGESDIWYAEDNTDINRNGISDVAIFSSNEVSLKRLQSPKNSGLPNINYYGNIDKILTTGYHYNTTASKYESNYPIVASEIELADNEDFHSIFKANLVALPNYTSNKPVSMKYKSTPHAVLSLNYTNDHKNKVLPTIKDGAVVGGIVSEWDVNPVGWFPSDRRLLWDKKKQITGFHQDSIELPYTGNSINGTGLEYGFMWLGELYNDDVINRFGGTSNEALTNNQWLPCGEAISILPVLNPDTSNLLLKWSEGDTFFQRYDNLKTYPFTNSDQNSVVDVLSFMVETRINLDGRYDKNRGTTNSLNISPENFNKMNPVYSQKDNYFTYRMLEDRFNIDEFKNTVSWSKTKTLGELNDTWTNLNVISTLDLDGDKGAIISLQDFNNNIYSFQEDAISGILFNSRTQISSTEGVPIEIANSGKVEGKRYLTKGIGCSDSGSICNTPYGIYFIDNNQKAIYKFDGKIANLSTSLGMRSWANNNLTKTKSWNPLEFNNFVTYYDHNNDDVLFISDNQCLAYSEILKTFTSFYSYEHTPYMIGLDDKFIAINKDDKYSDYKLWVQNEGDYNYFFSTYKEYYTTLLVNTEMNKTKIFNNIEFASDTFDNEVLMNNKTFNKLKAWNEYQIGESNLILVPGKASSLKKKFRLWRANIPRVNGSRDRIRNPWTYLKLTSDEENNYRTVLHDVAVNYFD